MKREVKYAIIETAAVLLIILFAYTAINKWMEQRLFIRVLKDSPLLSPIAPFLAWAVPLAETGIVILFFIPRFRTLAFGASALLLLAFTIYIAGMYFFAPSLPCSCGGVISSMSWGTHIIFNTGMTLLAGTAWHLARNTEDFTAINRNSRIPV